MFVYRAGSFSTALGITSSYDIKSTAKILQMKQDTFALYLLVVQMEKPWNGEFENTVSILVYYMWTKQMK